MKFPESDPEARNKDQLFDSPEPSVGLRHQSLRAGRSSLIAQTLKLAMRLGSMMILARVLLPEDFGLVAMVASIIGIADLFREFGLSTATIQRRDITRQQVTNLFWINAGIGVATAGCVALAAPFVAEFYNESRLSAITQLLSVNALLGALSVQHQAILRRQLRFGALAVVEVVALLAGISVGVVSAINGASYWALIAMALVTSLATLTLSWRLAGWRPGWPRRGSGTLELVRFGRDMFLTSSLGYVSRNLDNVLIGWRWGGVELGLYSRAYQLFMLPLNQIAAPISAVSLPTLSRLQDDPERMSRYFRKILFLVSAATIPVAILLAAFSEEAIQLLLGSGWEDAAPILFFLSIAGVTQPVMNCVSVLYAATGRATAALKWAAFSSFVFCSSFLLGLPSGAVGVATAYACARFVLLIPAVWFATRGTTVGLVDVFSETWPSLVAGLVAAAVARGALCVLDLHMPSALSVVVAVSGGLLVGSLILLVLDRQRILLTVLRGTKSLQAVSQ